MIDLRSDTVTLPTPAMREAIYRAEVGDDVMGEDPSVNRLEEMAAERMGKPAALFVASGTMGNLAALLAHCQRGDEVILGNLAHTFLYEAGGMAALGGIHPHTLPNQPDGTLDLDQVRAALRPDNPHFPPSRLIALENTHNRCGGVAIAPDYFSAVRELADRRGLCIHLDGARIFNAAVALGVDPREITQHVDSVTFCLSKGLSAPVGSVLCGDVDMIYHAHRARKMLGGGMRQAGILAAAGIVALEQMVERLAEDHVRARRLAEGMANIPGLVVDLERVQTNIVYFSLTQETKLTPEDMAAQLRERGVLVGWARAVTHRGIDDADIETALAALSKVLRG
ncbi:MAG: low-specificity L-threonine aldolase [Anaerolineae bacterium]|jgi:threonine aldolase